MTKRGDMTPRERWQAVLQRRPADRTPTDYWGTPEITQKLVQATHSAGKYEMLRKLNVDFVYTVKPRYVGPALPPDMDAFGVRYRQIDYGTGVYPEAVEHPLANYRTVEEIQANYQWPEADWWDYSSLAEQIHGFEDYPIQGGGSEPFYQYKYLRGEQAAFMDMAENPEILDYCLGKLFDLAYQDTLRILESIPGQVLLTYVAEDMGAQTGLMFSPRHIQRFFLPGMRRMVELTHQAGAYAFHHNDGAIRKILPELVGAGIDLLNPIQWRAGEMDRALLKAEFGDELVFHGGMDNQYTLPFGTVEEVRAEVRENLDLLGKGGGYILAPCHNLQPLTPVENILAMYQAAYEDG